MSSYSHLTFMLCLPRSRSAWMAEFMRPFCALSLHNPLQQCASIEELAQRIDAAPEGKVFVADVAAMFFFDQLVVRFPGAQYLIVHRPAREVEHAINKLGLSPPLNIRAAEKQLLEIGQGLRLRSDTMAGTFFELHSPEIIGAIAKFVLGIVPPYAYFQRMKLRNVQVPLQEQVARTDIAKQRVLFGKARIIH